MRAAPSRSRPTPGSPTPLIALRGRSSIRRRVRRRVGSDRRLGHDLPRQRMRSHVRQDGGGASAGTSWWSTDGQHWHAASGGDCLLNIGGWKSGLRRADSSNGNPGDRWIRRLCRRKTWSNRDDPLGYWSGARRRHCPRYLTGDGNRILAYGTTQQSQFLLTGHRSMVVTGPTSARRRRPALPHDVTPVLLRNGVLFIGTQAPGSGPHALIPDSLSPVRRWRWPDHCVFAQAVVYLHMLDVGDLETASASAAVAKLLPTPTLCVLQSLADGELSVRELSDRVGCHCRT